MRCGNITDFIFARRNTSVVVTCRGTRSSFETSTNRAHDISDGRRKTNLPSVYELAHDARIAGERYGGYRGKRQLQTHYGVEYVVHSGQLLDSGVKCQEERGHYGDGTRQQDPLPPGPLEVQEALHRELAGVGAWRWRMHQNLSYVHF